MRKTSTTDVRTRLVEAATDLAHRHGFDQTTLADIAKAAKVPAGNVYYYFKTKEDIGEAVVERRFSELSLMSQELGKLPTAQERLCALVLASLPGREMVAQHGCPIGTFCSEVNKRGGFLAKKASKLFVDLLSWAEAQFGEFSTETEARGRALHLISALQGVTVLANCSKNPEFVKMEANHLVEWIRSL